MSDTDKHTNGKATKTYSEHAEVRGDLSSTASSPSETSHSETGSQNEPIQEPTLLGSVMRSRKFLLCVAILFVVGGYFGMLEIQLSLARSALYERNAETALMWLKRADSFGFARSETSLLTARAYRRLGDFEKTHFYLQQALDRGHPEDLVHREQVMAFAQAGQLQQAVPFLREMLMNPGEDGPEICEAFVNGYLLTYLIEDAFVLLDVWQKDFPNDAQPFYIRGRYALHMGDHKGASGEFEKALKLSPGRREIRNELAHSLIELQQYDKARSHLKLLLNSDPSDSNARMNWAKCLQHTGESEEAQRQYEMVLDTNPENDKARLALGRLLASMGKAKDALDLAAQLFEKTPKNVDVVFLYAQALQAHGETDRAAKLFEQVEESRTALSKAYELIDNMDRTKSSVKDRVEIGRLLVNNGETESGVAWLMSALQMEPETLEAVELLATHLKSSHPTRAAFYEKAAAKLKKELSSRKRSRSKQATPQKSNREKQSKTGKPEPIGPQLPGGQVKQ